MSLALAVLLAAQAAAADPAPIDYRQPNRWLCLPGRLDTCTLPLPTTEVTPAGYGSPGIAPVARNPRVDCFVVYPTVSRDRGLNSDLVPGDGEERASIASQFARFSGACRVFAPIYRSMTLGAITYAATGGDVSGPAMLAYGDVRDAFRTYMARHNKGRPYVLIGHSQGSLMLQQLIANEIEGKPAARQMKLAIIPGYNLL
ncbi:MAG TPA: DUF3089 domain-containing protein, partial [Sphingomicrobium sp.]|nr:DUF3089 domain-containing protein [Sphingomicrobium sp.]